MVDIKLLKQIFGDNVAVISSPEDLDNMIKNLSNKVQPKEEEEHDCSKCKIPQNLCFAKPEVRAQFNLFAAEIAAKSIQRIIGGDDVSTKFSVATILKFTDKNPEVSGLKPTIASVLDTIEEGDEKAAANIILELVLLYLWCNK